MLQGLSLFRLEGNMVEEKKEIAAKEEKVKLEISKSALIWICVVIIIVLVVFITMMWFGGIQNLDQATEAMTNVSSDISRISSILEDIAAGLG